MDLSAPDRSAEGRHIYIYNIYCVYYYAQKWCCSCTFCIRYGIHNQQQSTRAHKNTGVQGLCGEHPSVPQRILDPALLAREETTAFMCAAWDASWASHGETRWWTTQCSKEQTSRRYSPSSNRDEWDGWAMSAGWKTDAPPRAFSMVSWWQRRDSLTGRLQLRHKNTLYPSMTSKLWASTATPGKQPLQTGPLGNRKWRRVSLSLERTSPDAGGRGEKVRQEDTAPRWQTGDHFHLRKVPQRMPLPHQSPQPHQTMLRQTKTQRHRTPWSPKTDGSLLCTNQQQQQQGVMTLFLGKNKRNVMVK